MFDWDSPTCHYLLVRSMSMHLVFNLALQVEDWLCQDLHVPAIQIVYAANNAHSEVILMGEQEQLRAPSQK